MESLVAKVASQVSGISECQEAPSPPPDSSEVCVSAYGRRLLFSFALWLELHSWSYGGLRVLESRGAE